MPYIPLPVPLEFHMIMVYKTCIYTTPVVEIKSAVLWYTVALLTVVFYSCNMGTSSLSEMYSQSLRAQPGITFQANL